jgi:DNA-binding CsgD family transcriptional regulator
MTSKGKRLSLKKQSERTNRLSEQYIDSHMYALAQGLLPARDLNRAEEALRHLRENLLNVFEVMKDGVYIVDSEYTLQYINPALSRDFPSSTGDKCYQYFHHLDKPCRYCRSGGILAGKTVHWECHIAESDKIYELVGTPVKSPDGIISSLVICRDVTEHRRSEEILKKANARLEVEQKALHEKNIALKEVLDQIDQEKTQIAFQVQSNIEKIAIPIVRILEERTGSEEKHYISLLENCLSNITSPFISLLQKSHFRLSPREMEICNMVKNGMTSKQIATLLNISVETVRKQRQNIRKKLNITNEKTNLHSYLSELGSINR